MDAKDYFDIQNLIVKYAYLLDRGEIDQLASMFEHAVFHKPNASYDRDTAGLVRQWRDWVRFYPPGNTPSTVHNVSNIMIESDGDGDGDGRARAQSYLTVFQATPGFSLQPIIAVVDKDVFVKVDGSWRFEERREELMLIGDTSAHLQHAVPA